MLNPNSRNIKNSFSIFKYSYQSFNQKHFYKIKKFSFDNKININIDSKELNSIKNQEKSIFTLIF